MEARVDSVQLSAQAIAAGNQNQLAHHVTKKYSTLLRRRIFDLELESHKSWTELINQYKFLKKPIPIRNISVRLNLGNLPTTRNALLSSKQDMRHQLLRSIEDKLAAILFEISEYESKAKIKINKHVILDMSIDDIDDPLSRFLMEVILIKLANLGLDKIWLSDSEGKLKPEQVRKISRYLIQDSGYVGRDFGWEFKENGFGLVNTLTAVEEGVTWFKTTLGGIDNKNASPSFNISSEDLSNLIFAIAGHRSSAGLILKRGAQKAELALNRDLLTNPYLLGLHRLSDNHRLELISYIREKLGARAPPKNQKVGKFPFITSLFLIISLFIQTWIKTPETSYYLSSIPTRAQSSARRPKRNKSRGNMPVGTPVINADDKDFVRKHQDRLEELDKDTYATILKKRFVNEWALEDIAKLIGVKNHQQVSYMLKIALEDFRTLINSGRPSIKKLVEDNNSNLAKLIGNKSYADALRLYYLSKWEQKRIAKKYGVDSSVITRRLANAELALLKALNLAGPSDEELVIENLHLLATLDSTGYYETILRLRFMGKLTFAEIGKRLGKNEFAVAHSVYAAIKLLRKASVQPEPPDRLFVRQHQDVLPELDDKHNKILTDHYILGKSITQLSNEMNSPTSQISHLRRSALQALKDHLVKMERRRKMIGVIRESISQGVDFSKLTKETVDQVEISDSTLTTGLISSQFDIDPNTKTQIIDRLVEGRINMIEAGSFIPEESKDATLMAQHAHKKTLQKNYEKENTIRHT
jgi:DNA-directed RNA polymerase specialized sigma24 family protein